MTTPTLHILSPLEVARLKVLDAATAWNRSRTSYLPERSVMLLARTLTEAKAELDALEAAS